MRGRGCLWLLCAETGSGPALGTGIRWITSEPENPLLPLPGTCPGREGKTPPGSNPGSGLCLAPQTRPCSTSVSPAFNHIQGCTTGSDSITGVQTQPVLLSHSSLCHLTVKVPGQQLFSDSPVSRQQQLLPLPFPPRLQEHPPHHTKCSTLPSPGADA